MSDVRIVLSTIDSLDKAEQIAETLVTERLAACVNILPDLISVYKWKNSLEKEREILLIVKTSAARLTAVEERFKSLHPYEVPEIIHIQVEGGSAAYLDWVLTESR